MKKMLFIFLIVFIRIPKAYSLETAAVSDMEMVVQQGHSDWIQDLAISPNGKFIISLSENIIKLWEIDGKLVRTFFTQRNAFRISFSPDGKYIVSLVNNGIQIWNVEGKLIKTIDRGPNNGNILYSPDGKYIVRGSDLWDLSGKLVRRFNNSSNIVTSASFNSDGKQIVTGLDNGAIQLWNITGELIKTFDTNNYSGFKCKTVVEYSPDGKYICSVTIATKIEDSSIKIWDNNGRLIRSISNQKPHNISFSPDGKYIAYGFDKQIKILNKEGVLVKTISQKSRIVLFTPDGKYIVCEGVSKLTKSGVVGRDDRLINLYDINGELIRTFGGGFSSLEYVEFSPNGKYIAAVLGLVIKLWGIDCKVINTFRAINAGKIAFSPDGKYIASGDDFSIKILDIDSKEIKTFKSKAVINQLTFSPDGKFIATSAQYDNKGKIKIKLWSIDGKQIRDFEGHNNGIEVISFSPDGKYIASGSRDKTMKLWSLDGTLNKTFIENGIVNSLSFSPDGKSIILAVAAGMPVSLSSVTLKLWNIDEDVTKSFGSSGKIAKVQFSSDGKLIASAAGKTVQLWDKEGKLIRELKGHNSQIYDVSFRSNGKHLVSGSEDGTVKIWNIETGNHVSLVSSQDTDDWIMYTPDGYFDASKNGGELVAMVKELNAFGVDQFAIRNNRPDIILKRIGLGDELLINHYYQQYKKRLRKMGLTEEKLSSDYHVPLAKIIESKQNGKFLDLKFNLNDDKYNLKRYNIYINDVPIYGAYGKEVTGNNIDKTETVELTSGKNKIEVTCINEAGAESFRALAYADYKEKIKGDLYYIGFGVSNYKNKEINLKYAHKDVLDLGNLLSRMKNEFNNIHIKTYINEEVTTGNIKNAKEFLREAKVDDTFILFIAGHGLHDTDEEATYYYLTHEADVKNLKNTAADFELIEDILQGINPRKKIFLIDACESGEIDEDVQDKYYAMADSRGLKARTTRGIKVAAKDLKPAPRDYLFQQDRFIYNDLMRRSGAIVFSSSKGGEFSYEKDEFQNGLFTKAILNSLTQKDADKNNDNVISTDELREYVSETVPKISDNLQHPTVDRDNIYQKFGFQMVK